MTPRTAPSTIQHPAQQPSQQQQQPPVPLPQQPPREGFDPLRDYSQPSRGPPFDPSSVGRGDVTPGGREPCTAAQSRVRKKEGRGVCLPPIRSACTARVRALGPSSHYARPAHSCWDVSRTHCRLCSACCLLWSSVKQPTIGGLLQKGQQSEVFCERANNMWC